MLEQRGRLGWVARDMAELCGKIWIDLGVLFHAEEFGVSAKGKRETNDKINEWRFKWHPAGDSDVDCNCMTITAIDESGYWASYHQEKHDKLMNLSVQVQVDSSIGMAEERKGTARNKKLYMDFWDF